MNLLAIVKIVDGFLPKSKGLVLKKKALGQQSAQELFAQKKPLGQTAFPEKNCD